MFLLVLVVVVFYFFTDWFSKTTGFSINENEADKLAGCLAGKNVSLYGFKNCKSCEIQKDLFDGAIRAIEYIECPNSRCLGVKSFPAWNINGKIYYGMKGFDELQNLSAC